MAATRMGVADLILLHAWLFVGSFLFLCSVRDGLSPSQGSPLRNKKRFNVSELIVRSSATWWVEDGRVFGTEQGQTLFRVLTIVGPTKLPVQWPQGIFLQEQKMTGCKADQVGPPSSNTEVQNRNNFTTTITKLLQGAQSELSESVRRHIICFTVGKWPGSQADRSPPSSARLESGAVPQLPICLHWMHRYNFYINLLGAVSLDEMYACN
jgi:hypothetical protein